MLDSVVVAYSLVALLHVGSYFPNWDPTRVFCTARRTLNYQMTQVFFFFFFFYFVGFFPFDSENEARIHPYFCFLPNGHSIFLNHLLNNLVFTTTS